MKIQTSLFCTLIITCFLANVEVRAIAAPSTIPSTLLPDFRDRQTALQSIRGGARKNALVVEKKENPFEIFINTVKESKRHLAAAAAARSVSIFSMFPVGMSYNTSFLFCHQKWLFILMNLFFHSSIYLNLLDTIKTRLQLKVPNPFKLDGLYNGVGGSLLGQVPYG